MRSRIPEMLVRQETAREDWQTLSS